MRDLLTVAEAAKLAGVSVRTMRRRVAAGEVMTSGHGQARRIVAAAVAAAPLPGDSARGGHGSVTPASVTPAMTEDKGDMTEDNAAIDTPAMAALVSLVDRLTAENRDLGRQLVDVTAAATMWQERARMLSDQLALAAPQQPVEASGGPAPAETSTGAPRWKRWLLAIYG